MSILLLAYQQQIKYRIIKIGNTIKEELLSKVQRQVFHQENKLVLCIITTSLKKLCILKQQKDKRKMKMIWINFRSKNPINRKINKTNKEYIIALQKYYIILQHCKRKK